MSLVTIDDIEELTGPLNAEEEAAAQLLIDTVEGELELFINRPLTPRVFTNEAATINSNGYLFLRHTPVISVQAITYQSSPSTAYSGAYTITPGGLLFSSVATSDVLLVDYTAGLQEPDNTGLKSIVLARLSRMMAKVHDDALGVASLTQEGYNAPYLPEGFTDQELKLADRRRKRVVRT